jgi:hypothetical protein
MEHAIANGTSDLHHPFGPPLLLRIEQPSLPDPIDDPFPQEERLRLLDLNDAQQNTATATYPALVPGGPAPSTILIREVTEAIRRNNIPEEGNESSVFRGTENANVRSARQRLSLHLRVINGRLRQVFADVPQLPPALTRPHHNNNAEDHVRSMFIAAHDWIIEVRRRLTAAMLNSSLVGFNFELYTILRSELNVERLISRLWSPYRELMATWLVLQQSARDSSLRR